MADGWLPHGDGKVFWETVGEGPAAIVMPVAWGMSHGFYQTLFEVLDLPFSLTYFDPEGVGASSRLPIGWNPGVVVDEAETVRSGLELGHTTVIGHASGAFLALEYALEHPEAVAALILVSPFASYARVNDSAAERMESRPNWASFESRVADMKTVSLSADERFRAVFKEQRAVDMHEYGMHYFQMADAADQATFNPDMHDDGEVDLFDELSGIAAPTLIISGLDDPLSPVEESRLIAGEIPYVRLVELRDCGHFPFVEQASAFVDAVGRFAKDAVETD